MLERRMLNFQPRRFEEIPESKLTTHLNSLLNGILQVKRKITKRFSVLCRKCLQMKKKVLKVLAHKCTIPHNFNTSFQ